MIRIRPTQAPTFADMEVEDPKETKGEAGTFKEEGYKLGSSGNQSANELDEALTKIGEREIYLEREYEAAIKEDKELQTKPVGKIEDILWRQLDLEREKVNAYQMGYIREKLLRQKAVAELWKH